MISNYANDTCTVSRPAALNVYGERITYTDVATNLKIFYQRRSRLVLIGAGWLRPYDMRIYIEEGNTQAYVPQLDDKFTFSTGAEYHIVGLMILKGIGPTHFGFRVDLKAITSTGAV